MLKIKSYLKFGKNSNKKDSNEVYNAYYIGYTKRLLNLKTKKAIINLKLRNNEQIGRRLQVNGMC